MITYEIQLWYVTEQCSNVIAVCTYCLVMSTGNLKQNPRQFFCDKNLLEQFFLSWTEFCLGSHIVVVFHMQSFNIQENDL